MAKKGCRGVITLAVSSITVGDEDVRVVWRKPLDGDREYAPSHLHWLSAALAQALRDAH